jgi:hypothetical protein
MFLVRGIPRLAAILTLAAVLVVTAGPANAATGSVQIGPTATLVTGGLALDVPVTVTLTCDEGFDSGLVQVFVRQARGTSVNFGEGSASFADCTGETQTFTVRVFGGVLFHGGRALASATLLQCGFNPDFGAFCSFTDISTNREIMIRGG